MNKNSKIEIFIVDIVATEVRSKYSSNSLGNQVLESWTNRKFPSSSEFDLKNILTVVDLVLSSPLIVDKKEDELAEYKEDLLSRLETLKNNS